MTTTPKGDVPLHDADASSRQTGARSVRIGPVGIATVLKRRSQLRRHERWTPERIQQRRDRQLDALRQYAVDRSPFYREFHAGLAGRPLEELPVLTKQALMDSWDRVTTDRALRLDQALEFVAGERRDPGLFQDRYYVVATSGSSGRRGIFVYNANEWRWILASYSRSNDWAGVAAGLFHHLRLAVVSTTRSWHQSALVGASLQSPLVPTLRLDATAPLPLIVERLNDYQPGALVAYAGMAHVLAGEQAAGRLAIDPKAVFSASEVLTASARADIADAFGSEPYETYAATETAGIASDCRHHHLHLFEDLIIPEIVDDGGLPVAPGEFGSRLLVTVLFSRTIPLIRYELTDRVALATDPYPCELPFQALAGIEGRTEDVLSFSQAGGTGIVSVHPNVFHDVLDRAAVSAWQVEQLAADRVRLRVVPSGGFNEVILREVVEASLRAAGTATEVEVAQVTELERNAAGKIALIRALPLDRGAK